MFRRTSITTKNSHCMDIIKRVLIGIEQGVKIILYLLHCRLLAFGRVSLDNPTIFSFFDGILVDFGFGC